MNSAQPKISSGGDRPADPFLPKKISRFLPLKPQLFQTKFPGQKTQFSIDSPKKIPSSSGRHCLPTGASSETTPKTSSKSYKKSNGSSRDYPDLFFRTCELPFRQGRPAERRRSLVAKKKMPISAFENLFRVEAILASLSEKMTRNEMFLGELSDFIDLGAKTDFSSAVQLLDAPARKNFSKTFFFGRVFCVFELSKRDERGPPRFFNSKVARWLLSSFVSSLRDLLDSRGFDPERSLPKRNFPREESMLGDPGLVNQRLAEILLKYVGITDGFLSDSLGKAYKLADEMTITEIGKSLDEIFHRAEESRECCSRRSVSAGKIEDTFSLEGKREARKHDLLFDLSSALGHPNSFNSSLMRKFLEKTRRKFRIFAISHLPKELSASCFAKLDPDDQIFSGKFFEEDLRRLEQKPPSLYNLNLDCSNTIIITSDPLLASFFQSNSYLIKFLSTSTQATDFDSLFRMLEAIGDTGDEDIRKALSRLKKQLAGRILTGDFRAFF